MARIIRKALILFGVVAALLILLLILTTLHEPKFVPATMPNPNGYDDLLFAAQLTTAFPGLGTNQPSLEELKKTVAQNAEALQTARRAFSNECRVRLEDPFGRSLRLGTAPPSFRGLAEAFRVEGRLAELENRPADAAQSYLAMIRLGQEIARGGLLIDAMTASAIESYGLTSLAPLAQSLTAEQCKEAAMLLSAMDAKRETVENDPPGKDVGTPDIRLALLLASRCECAGKASGGGNHCRIRPHSQFDDHAGCMCV